MIPETCVIVVGNIVARLLNTAASNLDGFPEITLSFSYVSSMVVVFSTVTL